MRKTAEHVVASLVSEGLLDPARSQDAETVVARSLGELPTQRTAATPAATPAGAPSVKKATTRSLLVEIAAYVGGALVVASVGLFLGQEWESFSDTARVVTLAGIAVLLAAAGLVVSRVAGGYAELRSGGDEIRRRLTSALLTAASLAASVAVGLQLSNQLDDPGSSVPFAVGSVTMLLLASISYRYSWSALGLLAIAAAGFNSVLNTWSVLDESGESMWVPSLALLGLALVWLVLTESGRFHEPAVARLVGMGIALFGAQLAMSDGSDPGLANLTYGLLLLVAVAGFAMYLRTTAWPYLVAGVLGVTIVVPEAVIDWTGGALGPAGAVLVAGLTLLGASLAGFRFRQEVADEDDSAATVDEPTEPPVGAGSGR